MAHWFNLLFHVLILGSTHSILNKISSTCALKKKDVNRSGKMATEGWVYCPTLNKISNWSPFIFTLVLKVRIGYTNCVLL